MWDEIQIQCCDANEIAEALINNEVSLVQLKSVPVFAAKSRLVEEAVWDLCKSNNTISGYDKYLNIFPNGIHAEEAKMHIDDFYGPIIGIIDDRNWLEKKRIIDALADDCNAYSLDYLKAMEFVPDDLMGILRDSRGQVRNEVLNSWGKEPLHLDLGKTPESIPTGTTEVYFWGIPGAGHTCLIASILNVAKRIGVYCSRSETVNDLASVFDDNSSTPAVHLPAATFADGIQCLPLSLIENKGKKKIEHRLSIMEHSGELFEGFSMELCGQPFSGGGRHGSYERLKMWLSNSNNSKYHFFIVDAKPGLDNPQQRYIEEAVLYFKQAGLFNETTQGISIIVTKCDELSPDSSEWLQLATEYIKNCYPAMVNQLKQIVGPKRHGGLGICDGTIKVIPFSIGDVFLQKLCLFNPEPAERMVKLLMECSSAHKGWLDLIKKVLL